VRVFLYIYVMEKSIDGYGVKYFASTNGHIKNSKGRVLKTWSSSGHLQVELYLNGIGKKHYVHRLIASTFLGSDNEGKVVNHKNGNKSDNRIENLEWCTQKENVMHYVEMYDQRYVSKVNISKLYSLNKDLDLKSFVEMLMKHKDKL